MSLNVNFSPLGNIAYVNCFIVDFVYQYGDTEATTYTTKTYKFSKDKIEDFLNKVEEIKKEIRISRANGTSLRNSFKEEAVFEGEFIPVDLDLFACTHMSHYYAAMRIENITYYDAAGAAFKVLYDQSYF